ncbi:hypothetical protein BaRGS_00037386, partial [Batillaria attramentaria]
MTCCRIGRLHRRRTHLLLCAIFGAAVIYYKFWTWSDLVQRDSSSHGRFKSTSEVNRQRQHNDDIEIVDMSADVIVEAGDVNITGRWPIPRDVMLQEDWPEVEGTQGVPAQVPHTVHYVWCGSKQLRFQHYLGLLSAVRVLQPVKLVFHYTELPVANDYNDWFEELTNSMPTLVLRQQTESPPCGSRDLLDSILDLLSQDGGVYVGENIILSRRPQVQDNLPLWFAFANTSSDLTRGVIYSARGFDVGRKQDHVKDIESSKPSCVSKESYNINTNAKCIVLSDDNFYPRDIMYEGTPFAEMARWLFYGKRAVPRVRTNQGERIPRIAHFVWFQSKAKLYNGDLTFAHFLSILSALYVGGFHSAYVHGATSPQGYWWDQLKTENIIFVPTQRPETVFQHPIGVRKGSHVSNLLRIALLYKYGGVYQDNDVYWVQPVPDNLFTYPFVASLDWPKRGEWPETINNGVLMAQRRSHYIHLNLATFVNYVDHVFGRFSLKGTYRSYELHPDTMLMDNRLQVICHATKCHPAWKRQIQQENFNWREIFSVHVTLPKPAPAFVDLNTLRNSTG